MEFIANPFLLSEEVTMPGTELEGICWVQLGCCCLALTGS